LLGTTILFTTILPPQTIVQQQVTITLPPKISAGCHFVSHLSRGFMLLGLASLATSSSI